MEWYDPSAITTKNGALEITLSDHPTKGMDYTVGPFINIRPWTYLITLHRAA